MTIATKMTHPAGRSGTFSIGGDMPVVRLGYGAMRITGPGIWGPPEDHDEAIRVLRRAVDLGVTLIDTADSYGPYVSEELIREALHPYPADVVIATKAGLVRTGPDEWYPLGRPEFLRQETEMSLRRLGVERIDLLQLHRVDPLVPFEEQVGTLVELQHEGKIRHIGLSNVSVQQILAAQYIARIVTVQNRYNLVDRTSEAVFDFCAQQDIGFIPWFPMATGELARDGGPLQQIAEELGSTPGHLALAWLLHRSPVMLPIPGTSTVAHLEDNIEAAGLRLTDAQFQALTNAV
jgi:aryl-alcohol dehydrogenase-like predicted oxidoreductase